MGPFANPNEVYAYYMLPYCMPSEIVMKREDLGPLLKGDRPTKTEYNIVFQGKFPDPDFTGSDQTQHKRFCGAALCILGIHLSDTFVAEDVRWKSLCKKKLTREEVCGIDLEIC